MYIYIYIYVYNERSRDFGGSGAGEFREPGLLPFFFATSVEVSQRVAEICGDLRRLSFSPAKCPKSIAETCGDEESAPRLRMRYFNIRNMCLRCVNVKKERLKIESSELKP